MPINFNNSKLYSVKELIEILPITPLTIREYIRKGKIKGRKIGKNWYVTSRDLSKFLEGDEAILTKKSFISGIKNLIKKRKEN